VAADDRYGTADVTVAVTCWFSSDYPQLPALVARGAQRTEQFVAADGLGRGRIGLSLLGQMPARLPRIRAVRTVTDPTGSATSAGVRTRGWGRFPY